MQNPRLKLRNVAANCPNGPQEFWIRGGMRLTKFLSRDSHRIQSQLLSIKLFCVFKDSSQTSLADIRTNPLDNLARNERLAEQFDGPLFSRFGNNIALRAELSPQFSKSLDGILNGTVNCRNRQRHDHSLSKAHPVAGEHKETGQEFFPLESLDCDATCFGLKRHSSLKCTDVSETRGANPHIDSRSDWICLRT